MELLLQQVRRVAQSRGPGGGRSGDTLASHGPQRGAIRGCGEQEPGGALSTALAARQSAQAGLPAALGAWMGVLAAEAAYNQGECDRVCETQQKFVTYAGLALFSIGAIAAIIGSCGLATPGVVATAGFAGSVCTVAGAGVAGVGIGSAIGRLAIEDDPDYSTSGCVRDVSLGLVGVGFSGLGQGIGEMPGVGVRAGRSVAWSAGVPLSAYRVWRVSQY